MKLVYSLSCALMFSFTSVTLANNTPEQSAEDWYTQSYGPLWLDPIANTDAIVNHYHKQVRTHAATGSPTDDNAQDWLAAPMKEWVAEGWIKAELLDTKTQTINASTAAIFAKWRDHYKSAPSSFACGWYLVDKYDSGWRISSYADTDCSSFD